MSATIPQHVAIIMDGNGRWAKRRGWLRLKGHEAGAESVRAAIKACRQAGVKYLTLYTFSVENWVRPQQEITGLMTLMRRLLRSEINLFHENKIRLRVIGRIQDLPQDLQESLQHTMATTKDYNDCQVVLALSYGGRAEIIDAARQLAFKALQGLVRPEDIDEKLFQEHLYAPDIPDPDLLIRTSGEERLSNFLIWECAYTEFYFTDVLWPDFREQHFREALEVYAQRHRRFGGVAEAQ